MAAVVSPVISRWSNLNRVEFFNLKKIFLDFFLKVKMSQLAAWNVLHWRNGGWNLYFICGASSLSTLVCLCVFTVRRLLFGLL